MPGKNKNSDDLSAEGAEEVQQVRELTQTDRLNQQLLQLFRSRINEDPDSLIKFLDTVFPANGTSADDNKDFN